MVFIGTSLKSVIKYFKRKGKICLLLFYIDHSVSYEWFKLIFHMETRTNKQQLFEFLLFV